MIRIRTTISCALASLAFALPSAAFADVIEVRKGGYRTIAADRNRPTAEAQVEGSSQPELSEPGLAAVAPVPVPAQWADKIAELSRRFDLSPSLIAALVWQESGWRENATSPVGARGLAQLMPGTARELGVNPFDPAANLEGGARYLRQQLDAFDGDIERALAAYNAGPGRVRRAKGVPRIKETQHYVAAIVNRLSASSGR
jgi:soluble lytic murein transglycosylase-like protein